MTTEAFGSSSVGHVHLSQDNVGQFSPATAAQKSRVEHYLAGNAPEKQKPSSLVSTHGISSLPYVENASDITSQYCSLMKQILFARN